MIQILYLLSFITPMFAWLFYKSTRPSMLYFYKHMALQYAFRRIYTLMVVLFLIAFHFYHLSVFQHTYCLVPSSAIVAMMYPHKFSEGLFHFLQNQRTLLATCFVAMLCLLFPLFLPLGFTLLVIAVAALFYPSKLLRNEIDRKEKKVLFWHGDKEAIVSKYFRWDLMEGYSAPQ